MWRFITGMHLSGLFLCLLANALPPAQFKVEIPGVQVSRSLSAIVIDPEGKPIEGVVVEEMTPEWKETLRTTKSDKSGVFAFAPVKGRKIYYFRLRSYGLRTLQFRLRVDAKIGKVIKLEMELAT